MDAQGQEILCCSWQPNGFAQGYTGVWPGGPHVACCVLVSLAPQLASLHRWQPFPALPTPGAAGAVILVLWVFLLANQVRVFVTSGAIAQW